MTSIPNELAKVKTALERNGFTVEMVMNPDSIQLYDAFRKFINRYGYDKDNRLLFFFSGHGYSRMKGKKGYLVPTDAPDPRKNEKEFLRKALTMKDILTWAEKMEAKHVLFLFDSCFSGTIFKTRALPKHPPHISVYTSRPVRQFITAGSEGEEVPAKSVFTPTFVRALRGEGDLNGDGYITGSEMGMYLTEKVIGYHTMQTPQYGKIRNPDLDEGDFVFEIGDQKRPEHRVDNAQDKGLNNAQSLYDKGLKNYEKKNYQEAIKLFLQAAELGNSASQIKLGKIYELGKGVEKDDLEMGKWYKMAAEQGDAKGEAYLGWMYYNGRGGLKVNKREASEWYRKAAEKGYSWAQIKLGKMYEHGNGVEKNDLEMGKWYKKAAKQGDKEGEAYLGWMYHNGRGGLKVNKKEGLKWYRKAAEKGYSWAQIKLGKIYEFGNGVEKDDLEMGKWYKKAAEQGNKEGEAYLGWMYQTGRGGVKRDKEKALKWYRKSAKKGYDWAKKQMKTL